MCESQIGDGGGARERDDSRGRVNSKLSAEISIISKCTGIT